jgi:predicted DsbA family dithiol-disulfide isomerase
VLEVFLFVNPIGMRCREAESAVIQLSEETDIRIDLHFVLLLNFQVIDQYMQRLGLDPLDLALRNRLFDAAYQIALDYQAAQYQGNSKARTLLMAEQEMFTDGCYDYDPAFAEACVKGYGLNWEIFQDDRHAATAGFTADQNIAQEMGVEQTPCAVLFDTTNPEAPGVRLGNLGNYERFKRVCERIAHAPQPAKPLLHVL